MLGEQIGEFRGKRLLRRVLSSDPLRVEVTFEDSGKILGAWAGTAQTNGFLRDSAGHLTTFSVPITNTGTFPSNINNHGHVTGLYGDSKSVARQHSRAQQVGQLARIHLV